MKDRNKDKIELLYRNNSVVNKYILIKVNGEFLKDMKVSDMGFYTDGFGTRNMIVKLNIPLDKYEITIYPDSEEKEK